jgi:hypothetical protein
MPRGSSPKGFISCASNPHPVEGVYLSFVNAIRRLLIDCLRSTRATLESLREKIIARAREHDCNAALLRDRMLGS